MSIDSKISMLGNSDLVQLLSVAIVCGQDVLGKECTACGWVHIPETDLKRVLLTLSKLFEYYFSRSQNCCSYFTVVLDEIGKRKVKLICWWKTFCRIPVKPKNVKKGWVFLLFCF